MCYSNTFLNFTKKIIVVAFCTLSFDTFATDIEEIGRLFYNPQQRAEMDRHRAAGKTLPEIITAPTAEDLSATVTTTNTATASSQEYKGGVVRSDGQHTYWLNDQVHSLSAGSNSARQLRGTQLNIQAQGKAVTLQPGQRYDLTEKRVRDVFDRPSPTKSISTSTQDSLQDITSSPASEEE